MINDAPVRLPTLKKNQVNLVFGDLIEILCECDVFSEKVTSLELESIAGPTQDFLFTG